MTDNEQVNPSQDPPDPGTLLVAAAQDTQPVSTGADIPPLAGSPVDAALAVLYAACKLSDDADDGELHASWRRRQDTYTQAINDGDVK
ncbi:hypothetical protein [Mycobacteroides abscessus]|uniref:hypothetical protein n=1 Tax=Mycobacteroides abscessus TaxID=36809 RepID=UPI001055F8F2|nr:hypothetical protein [Mycobacteroides abscessus]